MLILGALPESLLNFRGALIDALLEAGHDVLAAAGGEAPAVAAGLSERGVPYHPLRIQRTGTNPLADLGTLLDCMRLMKEVSPDVVLCYTAKPVIYGLIAARWTGVPLRAAMIEGLGFAFTGTSPRHRLLGGVMRFLYRASLSACQTVFFLNPDDQAFFNSHALVPARARQVRINGIGVDLAHFSPQPLPAVPSFLLVARLLVDKGVVEYAEAARQVKARFPAARFLLVGWLDENPSCIREEMLDAWVKDGTIDYLGRLSDVRPAYEKCSVYVLPSYREGLPVTIMEAMAMGRAIVATDVPGCRETVVEGINGYLVPARDADSLAQAMMRFVDNPALATQMGVQSRRLAEERFDVHEVNRQIIETLELG